MLSLATSVFLASFVLSADPEPTPLAAGTQYSYRGIFVPVKEDGQPAKKFELELIVLSAGPRPRVAWTITEQGRGAWSWPERFGVLEIANDWKLPPYQAPSLLVQREEGRYVVPVLLPFLKAETPLQIGSQWTEGKLEIEVSDEATRSERDCWEVDYRSPIGHKRTTWVAKDQPVIIEMKETVFIGPGQQHDLHVKLLKSEVLDEKALAKVTAAFESWHDLRQALNREPRTEKAELSSEQLSKVRDALPALAKNDAGPLAVILTAAEGDTKKQKDRAGAVSSLRTAAIGKSVGEFKLTDLTNREWTPADFKDKVVILHFWEYRDTPLEEPYGQVAYLDFFQRKWKDKVLVLGINVDPRLEDAATRRTAATTAKKLRDFMNLTYPILLDDGKFLKQVGDPRTAEAKLPLFVVLGKNGQVVEYHSGFYAVQRERGLADLEEVVKKASE